MPRYRVILHQDAVNDLMFVVRSVMEVTRFPRAEATHKMWEAHHRGRSILLTTYLERAEMYVVQFAGRGLKVTAEPASAT
jgi:ATP-dependent Clp protease adapter protein ClpS